MGKKDIDKFDEFENALTAEKKGEKYIIRLFKAGINPKNIKDI
ncbi:MAG: hypothetical protein ABFD07_18940 [Methanobacterium sp.]